MGRATEKYHGLRLPAHRLRAADFDKPPSGQPLGTSTGMLTRPCSFVRLGVVAR